MPIYANRKERRAARALEQKTGGVVVDREEIRQLHEMQRLFVAIVKTQGRVRVDDATLETLKQGDTIKAKKDGASLMLTFVAGETPAEGVTG